MKVTSARKIAPTVTASSSKLPLQCNIVYIRGGLTKLVGLCRVPQPIGWRMFHIAVEILIDKLCNMHGVPIGAWDIGSISVTTMTTQLGF